MHCPNQHHQVRHGSLHPNKTLKTKLTDPAWWSPECSSAIKKKGKAWRLHHRNPLSADFERAYKTATLGATSTVQRAKDALNLSIRRKINSGTLSSRQWWSTIKRASGCCRNQEIPILTGLDGREHTSSRDKTECFAKFFSGKCSLDSVEGIPSILTMTICMLNYYYTCCYVCSLRESLTVVDRGFSYI